MPEKIESGCCCFKRKAKIIETPEESTNTKSKVPFAADLPKDFGVGKCVCVTGIVMPNCSRFAVNLTCGRGPSVDIAFHFNPRLLQRYVVRNSRLNGQWGDEETTSPIKFGFEPGKKFNLSIFVGKGELFVALDGEHVCTYKFRVNLQKVNGIDVQGGVDVLGVEFKQLEIYPETISQNKALTDALGRRQRDDGDAKTAMETPVTFLLPEGFHRDSKLEIYGRVKILPYSFYINLQEGVQQWPHPIVPLHLNQRFSSDSGEPAFVRNAWIDGDWGQEERTPGFQFSPGSPFTMAIQRWSDRFSVWIDGQLAGEFKFRGSADKIDTVHIQGDILVYRVALNNQDL